LVLVNPVPHAWSTRPAVVVNRLALQGSTTIVRTRLVISAPPPEYNFVRNVPR
jgi:hypothetical protein